MPSMLPTKININKRLKTKLHKRVWAGMKIKNPD